MNLARLFILIFIAISGGIAFWQISDEATALFHWSPYQMPAQKTTQERQTQVTNNCQKYSAVAMLGVPLKGKVIAINGAVSNSTINQIASVIKQALPGTPVFVNGTLEERFGFDIQTFVRTGVPADAVVITVTERNVDTTGDQKRETPNEIVQTVVVSDGAGKKIGQWQGFMNGACAGNSARQTSLGAFIASQRFESNRVSASSRTSSFQDLQFDIQATKTKQVARPEDFLVPTSMPGCMAELIKENDNIVQTLRIMTGGGALKFQYFKENQTLPSIACDENRIAVILRTPTQVSVVSLDRNGFVLGVGRALFKKLSEREAFRDVRIQNGKLHATLLSFEVDNKGALTAYDGRALVVGLGADTEPASNPGDSLGLIKYTGCNQTPELDQHIQVHELPDARVAWEYVHIPGQEPVPFRSVVINAPQQSVAVSFPETMIEMVWLVQATPGTDLRYVEISGNVPQTVIMRGATTVVNVATDSACQTLFSSKSPSRSTFKNIRTAYKERGQVEAIGLVLLANGNPFVSSDFTYQAVSAFGYLHLSSLTSYYSHLSAEGFLAEAKLEDYQRFNDYFSQSTSFGRKVASWFKQDPAMDIHASASNRTSYLVKRSFPLPKHPDDTIKDTLLMVEKGVLMPSGNLKPYRILDANTLGCPGTQSNCPWVK